MRTNLTLFLTILLLTAVTTAAAQTTPTGRIRGTVIDGASGQPLAYVSVTIPGAGASAGVMTDENGAFSLPPVAVGRHDLQAALSGYLPASVRGVMVGSAKETVLEISMRENPSTIEDVVVRPSVEKDAPLNTMALVGARMFSVEETSRYAGGMDDPARMATSFAGAAGNVTTNNISIRGNSPEFLQWQLEGIEIPNPSHYPTIGAVGGGIITAFSSVVLGNSDFFTGAFPAQYGNALSGVFDIALRNGNNQRYEHTASLGTIGVEFGSEGPFKRGGQGSYLFNYRYSTFALAGDIMGGDMKDVAGMRYQDLSFKINLPTRRAGTFSLWGIATNDRFLEGLPDDPEAEEYQPSESRTRQYMAAAGLGHRVFVGADSYLKTTLAATTAYNHIWHDYLFPDSPDLVRVMDLTDRNTQLIFNSFLNTKFSARHTNRTGVTAKGLFYDNDYNVAPGYSDVQPDNAAMVNYTDADGSSQLVSAYSQSLFQLSDRWTAEVGVRGQYFALNKKWAVEPRASIRWQAAPRHSIALAAGMHSRHERLEYYFVASGAGADRRTNENLDFAKAAHLTASYDWSISDNLHLRVEPYFQYLYDVPVVPGTSESIINEIFYVMDNPLVNGGKARNVGVDMTLERYLRDGWYWMLTASVFDSRYTGDDGVWRDTRYNRRVVANALGGKEWMLGRDRRKVLGVSLRANVLGGQYYTPVDEAASEEAHMVIEDGSRTMAAHHPMGVYLHATVNYTVHRPRVSHEVGFKMMNITGTGDQYGWEYNQRTGKVDQWTTRIGIPNVYYRISF